jgi:hypothetical protein
MKIFKVPLRPKRFYDCANYNRCLTKAAHGIEPAVPCHECTRYKRRENALTYAEWFGILRLLEEVFRGEGTSPRLKIMVDEYMGV